MKNSYLYLLIIVAGGILINLVPARAAADFFYLQSIDYPLVNNFTLANETQDVSLKIFSQSISENLTVKMMNIIKRDSIGGFFTLPEGKTPASDLYFVGFGKASVDSFSVAPQLELTYAPDDKYKEAYFYDWLDMRFEKLESVRDDLHHTLTVKLPERKKIMIALFNEPELVGKASWYVHGKYAGQLIAASRDFAIDSQVKVTNLYNNKEVIVTIKDFGPKKCDTWTEKEQRLMGPCQDRILDLSKTAFLRLATTTGVGIISQARVTPVNN